MNTLFVDPETHTQTNAIKEIVQRFVQRGAIRCQQTSSGRTESVSQTRKRRSAPHYRSPTYMRDYMRDRRTRWHAMGLNSKGQLPKRPVIGADVMI